MRRVTVRVARAQGQRALEAFRTRKAANLLLYAARDGDSEVDVVEGDLPNGNVEPLLESLEGLDGLHVSWAPQGVLALRPPANEAPDQVRDVQMRSPTEVYLGGLQSVGSWKGFLGYAAVAGVVVWLALYTNTIYLLTAAMLIAPFAGPAMNASLATACGDVKLLGRSLLRYFASLALSIGVSLLLSFIFDLEQPSEQMMQTSSISILTVLLPLAAGAAGALNLVQSERSSLVSGAATGMLVAASLAPPAGMVGMALALGRGVMVGTGLFVILLQVVAINVSGAIVFRAFGLSARGARFQRGRSAWFAVATTASVICVGAMVAFQVSASPQLQRTTRTKQATTVASKAVGDYPHASFVEAQARIAVSNGAGPTPLLVSAWVRKQPDAAIEENIIKTDVRRAIQAELERRGEEDPLVDVTVLSAAE